MFPSIWRCPNPNDRTPQNLSGMTVGPAEVDWGYAEISEKLPSTGLSAHVTLALIVRRDFCDPVAAATASLLSTSSPRVPECQAARCRCPLNAARSSEFRSVEGKPNIAGPFDADQRLA
jgi:hypothetical protein